MVKSSSSTSILNQPKPFFMIFFVEFWERFGYYGLQGVLAVFFVRVLGFSEELSFVTFGAFAALVYGLVFAGGFIGDKVLGTKRTLLFGAIVLCIGYFMTAASILKPELIFYALGVIAVGNGLFKAHPSSLLSKCYEPGDPRIDGAFTMFYMSINIGSLISLACAPVISEHFGYSVNYTVCAIGLVLAVVTYLSCRRMITHIGSEPDHLPMNFKKFIYVIIGCIVMVFICSWLMRHVTVTDIILVIIVVGVFATYLKYAFALDKVGRNKMLVGFILMIEAIVFFILYAQMPTSLNFFAINNVRHEMFGVAMNPVSFQAFNPLWIVIGSPILATLYNKWGQKGKDLSIPTKFAIGMFLCSLGFFTASFSGLFADATGHTSAWWIFLVYLFQSFGELMISALGLAMVAALVPQRLMGFIFGAWQLTNAISFLLGGYVASFTAVPKGLNDPHQSLHIYMGVFSKIGIVTLIVAIIMVIMVPWLKRMLNAKNEEDLQESKVVS